MSTSPRIHCTMTLRSVLALPVLALCVAPAAAQTVWTIDNAAQATLHTGPASGPLQLPARAASVLLVL